MKDLEIGEVEFELVEEFLLGLRKKFRKENEEAVKIAKLKRVEQGRRTMEEFVQKFRRIVRESRYEKRALVEKFKREMSKAIRRNLIKIERPPTSIKQWYKYVTNLDRHWRESWREIERLRERRKLGN